MQTKVIVFLVFSLVVAVFAVTNMQPVLINYFFGTTEIPLIFVIIFSILFGAIFLYLLSSMKQLKLKRQLKGLEKEKLELESELMSLKINRSEEKNMTSSEKDLDNNDGQNIKETE